MNEAPMEVDQPVALTLNQPETLQGRADKLQMAIARQTERYDSFLDEDGYVDTAINIEAFAVEQKLEKLRKQLKSTFEQLELIDQAERTSKKRKSEVLREIEFVQKQAKNHFESIDNSAKLRLGNEIKMIDKFVGYCKAQIPVHLRPDVVPLLLSLCMKDDTRRDHFLEHLKAHKDFEKKRGDLDWTKDQFLKSMRGSDWQGNQLSNLVSIAMGYEQPQVWRARLLAACSNNRIDVNDPAQTNPDLIMNWAAKLPTTLQNQIQSQVKEICGEKGNPKGSISQFADLVCQNLKTVPDRIVMPRYPCGWCEEDLVVRCANQECQTSKRLKIGSNDGNRLIKEKEVGKENNHIPQKKSYLKEASLKDRTGLADEERASMMRQGLCFKCKKQWGQNPNCEACMAKGQGRKQGTLAMLPTVKSIEERDQEFMDEILDGAILGATMALKGHDCPEKSLDSLRSTCSLNLNGKVCKGLHLDTLSDYSYIVTPLANRLYGTEAAWKQNLSHELPEHQVICGNNEGLAIIGSLEIEVQGDYGPPFRHRFYVLPSFPANIYCIVGADLMKKLGVKLKNVPRGKDSNVKEGENSGILLAMAKEEMVTEQVRNFIDLGYSLSRCNSEFLMINKKDSSYQNLLYTYRLRLEQELEISFKKNKELKGFCSHPQAEIRFDTTDEEPVRSHQYAIPHKLVEHVDKYFTELLSEGVIEEETNLDHSLLSVLVVPKWSLAGEIKGWRICLDPRKINAKIKDAIYPLPLAEDIFAKLKGKKVFSILDLKSGFNQMRIRNTDRKKTAFKWGGKVYHFTGAPFGFKNIPQDFQQIMDRIFHDMPFVLIYIDDLIIASDTHEGHAKHVSLVMDRLNSSNLRVNREKCILAQEKLVVLGNMISEEGQQVAVEKLLKMDTWKNPNNLKMLQSQLGFINYFRGYIPSYSRLLAPIEKLRSQGNLIKWTEEHTNIMKKIRQILETEIMLVAPDYSRPLFVGTDASKYGIGAILYQIDDEGKKQIIRMASRSLKPSEINYGAPQRELRAVLDALRWFKVYLYGRKFTLYTDHQSLVYMLERDKISSVIENWMFEILSFNFEIKHLPGINNHLPDALSRFYDNDKREENRPDYVAELGESGKSRMSLHDQWAIKAPVFMVLVGDENEILNGTVFTETVNPDELTALENVEQQNILMKRAHWQGHLGAGEMVRLIKSSQRLVWKNMFRDCQNHVSGCLPCQRYNIGVHGYHPPKNLKALLPFDHLCIDLKEMPDSRKGNRYILVVIDVATRMVFLRSLQDKSMYSIAQKLLRLFCDVGFPKVLGSDNGTEFNNQILDAVKKISRIEGRFIAPYHHRSNGIVERCIRTMADAIYKRLDGLNSTWDEYLPTTQYYMNTRVLELHGSSPYSLLFARRPNDFADYRIEENLAIESEEDREKRLLFLNAIVFPTILEKVNKKHQKRNEQFMKKNRILKEEYPAGSQVMIKDEMRNDKTSARYEGPFTVVRREGSGNYLLKGIDGTEYSRPPQVLKLVAPEIVKDLKIPDTIFASVKEIVDHKEVEGVLLYRTRWKDQGPSQDSWLKHSDFVDYGPLQRYEKVLSIEKKSRCKNEVNIANGSDKLKVAKAGQRKMVEFNQGKISMEEDQFITSTVQPEMPQSVIKGGSQVSVALDLDGDQLDAVGEYWKTMRQTRKRNRPVVESDSENEQEK